MKNKLHITIILISLFFSVNEKSYAQIPEWEWAKQISGYFYHAQTTVDSLGNIYILGFFSGTKDFDPGSGVFNLTSLGWQDIFILKLNNAGNFIWVKQIGNSGSDLGVDITIDSTGDIYVTGKFSGTVDFDPGFAIFNLIGPGIFISKFDGSGNFVWAKSISNNSPTSSKVAIGLDSSCNVYVSGNFTGTPDFDPGPGTDYMSSKGQYDVFIIKLDSSGNYLWQQRLGGTLNDLCGNMTADASGNLLITGSFSGIADFGAYSLTSAYTTTGDNFICKLDNSGNVLWAKNMGTMEGTSVTVDLSGNIYSTGYFRGIKDFDPGVGISILTAKNYDAYITKLSSSGNFIWAKKIDGHGDEISELIISDSDSNIYIMGEFEWFGSFGVDFDPDSTVYKLYPTGGTDIFILKLNSSGNFIWAKSAGGYNNDEGVSLVFDIQENLYLTGHFQDSISFGAINLFNNSLNMFTAKLNQKPCNTVTCAINPTINIKKVSSVDCNDGKITVNLGGAFQAYPHVELYDSLNAIIGSVNLVPGTGDCKFKNLSPGSYTVKVFDNNCCEQVIPALVMCTSLTTGFKTTNIKTASARLKWKVASCVVSYRVQYRVQGTTVWTNRYVSGNQGYRTIVNLTPSTTYEWRIANMCIGSNTYPLKTASAIQTFTTLALRDGAENISNDIAHDAFEINLFPNPATYTLTVNFETEENTARLKVINTVGQVVFEKQLQADDGSYEDELDISKYGNGMYVLLVETENGVSRRRFAKE